MLADKRMKSAVLPFLVFGFFAAVEVPARDDENITAPGTPGPSPAQIQGADAAGQLFQNMAPRQNVPRPGAPIPEAYVRDPYFVYQSRLYRTYPYPYYPGYPVYPVYPRGPYPPWGWYPGYGPPVIRPYAAQPGWGYPGLPKSHPK